MKRRRTVLLGLAGLAVASLNVALVATSDVLATPVVSAVVRGATIVSWVLCGLWTWDRRRDSRLGPIMVLGVAGYGLGAINAIDAPAPFTLGSLLWVTGALLVAYVALVFPGGRLPDRTARVTATLVFSSSAILWTLLLLGVETMPTRAKPFRCEEGCPSNPFDVLHLSDAAGDALSGVAYGVLGVTAVVLIAILVARIRATSRAGRRVLMPAFLCLCLDVGAFALAFVLARIDDQGLADEAGWLTAATSMAFPVTLLLGQARGRLFAAASLRDMVRRVSVTSGASDLESVMADALGDPTLRLAFPVGDGGFVDGAGASIVVPGDPPAALTEIREGPAVTAVVLHDPALDDPPGAVEAAGAAIRLALDNARLAAAVRASERDLRESRARMLTAGVNERRRLERDLHDTAQQQLVALRIRFALAEERVNGDLGGLLRELGSDVEATIDRVRAVGRGLYPPLLADQGLGPALTSSIGAAPRRVALTVGSIRRTDRDVEAAVYLCCRSVIDVLSRTASRGGRVAVEIDGDDLRIAVGAAHADIPTPPSRLMTHMLDHLGSVGGRVDYGDDERSWRVEGVVPWPRAPDGAAAGLDGRPHGTSPVTDAPRPGEETIDT